MSATVQTYSLTTASGRPIRKATKVVFSDGTEFAFTERMPKGEAIRQAEAALGREPEEFFVEAFVFQGERVKITRVGREYRTYVNDERLEGERASKRHARIRGEAHVVRTAVV